VALGISQVAQLSNELHEQVESFCREADDLAWQGQYSVALERYRAAWELLPEPRTQWEAASWLLAAMGDAHFLSGTFAAARDDLMLALQCDGASGNAFLHMRLGQCLLELRNPDRAAEELTRAYVAAGSEIFDSEDPKYLAFLRTRIKIAPGGW
jgi:tetratricopeptide (TPR) repeat protein